MSEEKETKMVYDSVSSHVAKFRMWYKTLGGRWLEAPIEAPKPIDWADLVKQAPNAPKISLSPSPFKVPIELEPPFQVRMYDPMDMELTSAEKQRIIDALKLELNRVIVEDIFVRVQNDSDPIELEDLSNTNLHGCTAYEDEAKEWPEPPAPFEDGRRWSDISIHDFSTITPLPTTSENPPHPCPNWDHFGACGCDEDQAKTCTGPGEPSQETPVSAVEAAPAVTCGACGHVNQDCIRCAVCRRFL